MFTKNRKNCLTIILAVLLTMALSLPVLAFDISEIPDNTLKLGDDFFDLQSNPMADTQATVAIASLLKEGPNQNVAYFKFGGKWYDPFNLTGQQFLNPDYALTEAQVNAISGFNKWYKAGAEVVDIASGPTLSNVTVGTVVPEVSGTASAPILTFAVDPVSNYTTGSATLSMDVSFRIQSGTDIDVPGDATTSDNLVDTALGLLRAASGDPQNNGVYGSTLIVKSPVVITLTAGTAQTIYTINFVSAGPTVTNATVDGIEPTVSGASYAPVLTFAVAPATSYSTGTATLSEDVYYNIQNATYTINGTATTTDNLVDIALGLLAANGGSGTSVLGSTLITNSPLTITITGAKGTTVYTINFVTQ